MANGADGDADPDLGAEISGLIEEEGVEAGAIDLEGAVEAGDEAGGEVDLLLGLGLGGLYLATREAVLCSCTSASSTSRTAARSLARYRIEASS